MKTVFEQFVEELEKVAVTTYSSNGDMRGWAEGAAADLALKFDFSGLKLKKTAGQVVVERIQAAAKSHGVVALNPSDVKALIDEGFLPRG